MTWQNIALFCTQDNYNTSHEMKYRYLFRCLTCDAKVTNCRTSIILLPSRSQSQYLCIVPGQIIQTPVRLSYPRVFLNWLLRMHSRSTPRKRQYLSQSDPVGSMLVEKVNVKQLSNFTPFSTWFHFQLVFKAMNNSCCWDKDVNIFSKSVYFHIAFVFCPK